VDELLDDPFTPRLERALAEAAPEALEPDEADAPHLAGFTVEHLGAAVEQDLENLRLLARFVLVVSEHGQDRDLRRREVLDKEPRLVREPVVGDVPAQEQHVGPLPDLGEEGLHRSLRAGAVVDVAEGRDAEGVAGGRPAHHFSSMAAVQRAISAVVMVPPGRRRASR
jgi:hypothetical protein